MKDFVLNGTQRVSPAPAARSPSLSRCQHGFEYFGMTLPKSNATPFPPMRAPSSSCSPVFPSFDQGQKQHNQLTTGNIILSRASAKKDVTHRDLWEKLRATLRRSFMSVVQTT